MQEAFSCLSCACQIFVKLGRSPTLFKSWSWDFPDSPMVKNLPSNAGGAGLILGQRTKIPLAREQLSQNAITRESQLQLE